MAETESVETAVQHQVSRTADGASMKRLAIQRVSLLESLKQTGQLQPATILNFNPIRLQVEDGLIQYTVPPAHAQVGKKVIIPVGDQKYKASALVVRDPKLYFPLRQVSPSEEEGLTKEYDVKAALPIEQAYQFWRAYNDETGNNVGGVVVFQGAFVWDEEDKDRVKRIPTMVRVPKWRRLADKNVVYYTVEEKFEDVLRAALDRQRAYCIEQLQNAQTFYDDPEFRKSVTNIHKDWAQFALDMGWIQEKPNWMASATDPAEKCIGCGTPRKNTGALFCSCGRPYDAFEAFMKGEPVGEVYLATLPADKLKKVLAEQKRRADIIRQMKEA